MKKSRFTQSQIVSILNATDADMKTSEIFRKHGIADATYYNWKLNMTAWQPRTYRA
ncbi:MAG TPA: hypothetical protein EYN60_08255 [Nitrospirales bacterium]|nr:hypothetical protein [Nitrospirales bacterium]HIB54276.1 hypothetical protein [Nitrospirales bacterium]